MARVRHIPIQFRHAYTSLRHYFISHLVNTIAANRQKVISIFVAQTQTQPRVQNCMLRKILVLIHHTWLRKETIYTHTHNRKWYSTLCCQFVFLVCRFRDRIGGMAISFCDINFVVAFYSPSQPIT